MTVVLQYNGFTALQTVKIESWVNEPVFAGDGVTHETTRQTIVGTALIYGNGAATWKASLDNARQRLNEPRADFLLQMSGQTLLSTTGADDRDGPLTKFEIREIIGAQTALVTFTIEFHRYEPLTGATAADVLSNRWIQRWTYDKVGLATRYVAGVLTVKASALATAATEVATTSDYNAGSNPEAYRSLVAPNLPIGFRRIREEFAGDETGNRLLYSFEDQEFPRGLPFPMKDGDCEFSFRKDIQSGTGLIGVKDFQGWAVGDANTSAKDLLVAMIQLSQQRIVYSPQIEGGGADLILSMVVREVAMLSENRVELSITALAASASATGAGPIAPANIPMLGNVMEHLTNGYSPPSAYGTALARAKRRTIWTPSYTGSPPAFPVAQFEVLGSPPDSVDYQIPNAEFAVVTSLLVPQGALGGVLEPAVIDNHYVSVQITTKVETLETGMMQIASHAVTGRSKPFQWTKPRVFVIEEGTMARLNAAPARIFRVPPPNSVLRENRFNVTAGGIDANDNRIFQAVFRRVWELGDPGDEDAASRNVGWFTQTVGGVSVRAFFPILESIAAPIDPRVQEQILGNGTTFDLGALNYPLGNPDPFVNT